MKHFISLILLLSTTKAFTADTDTLVRFVCHRGEDRGFINTVVIVEQTSVKAIEYNENVDGSAMIDSDGEIYTKDTPFRMRIYNDVSLVSDKKTKEEIIEELFKQSASRDLNGELMDFTGKGGRFKSEFIFSSENPYDKSFLIDLNDPTYVQMSTSGGAGIMLEDGPYQCEDPVLIPVTE